EQMSGMAVWSELIDNRDLLKSQYEVVHGRMAENYDEVVLITNSRNSITDYAMYGLGLRDRKEIEEMTRAMFEGNDTGEFEGETVSYSFEEILDMSFKLVLNTDYFEKTENGWADRSDDEGFMKAVLDEAKEIKIVGIIRPGENSNLPEVSGAIGYYKDLTEYAINQVNDSEIVKAQKADPETDIFTGRPFPDPNAEPEPEEFDFSSLSPEVQMMLAGMSEDEIEELMEQFAPPPAPVGSYELNLSKLGVADLDSPVMISLFPKDFESKEAIERFINDYNKSVGEESAIGYTDYVGLMMSSVSSVINMISAILMAFVGISLVVSSIMIGIITYVSVLERTREIGILKSIGASKRDISRVFNAETLIVGFVAGMLGILIALLLTIPANIIIHNVSGATGIAALPFIGGSLLVVLSMGLTLIAGLIPSRIAAKKDPVVALRTE
ncbi:MAG: ABC transporter permease, partial [Oscillospiraceae bacterium]|nr:ABC transporter permease [Oscillospiraceae bacterium]